MYKSEFFTYIYIRAKKLGFRKKRDDTMATKTKYLKYDFLYTICTPHVCPECGAELKAQKRTKTVKLASHDETCEFDTVKLVFREFVCRKCNSHFPIDEIRQYEKEHKKEERK